MKPANEITWTGIYVDNKEMEESSITFNKTNKVLTFKVKEHIMQAEMNWLEAFFMDRICKKMKIITE